MNCPQLWPLATGSTLVWGRASTRLVGSSPREGAGPSLRQLHLFLQVLVAGLLAEPGLRQLHLFLQGVVAEPSLRLLHLFLQGVVAVPGLRQLHLVQQGVVAGVVAPPGFPCRR